MFNNLNIRDILNSELPYCRIHNSASQTISTATQTPMLADTESVNRWGMHSTSTNTSRITIPVSGVYVMNARVVWDNGTSSTRQLYLERNGSAEDLHAQIETFGLAGIVYQNGVSVWNLAKGDYVEVQVNQDTGGDLGCTLNHFAVVMVQ